MTYKIYQFQFSISSIVKPWEVIKSVSFSVNAYKDFEAYAQALTTIWNRLDVNTQSLAGVIMIDKE